MENSKVQPKIRGSSLLLLSSLLLAVLQGWWSMSDADGRFVQPFGDAEKG